MAKKKLKPSEDPPRPSSSDDDEIETPSGEEEEQISDDSSSAEDEDDLIMNPVIIIPPPTKSKTHAVASGSKNHTNVTVASPSTQGSIKRPSEKMEEVQHAKRSKIIDETKKALFQRLWSEEDEISLLQCMIDFKFETEKSPYEDMDEFYEFAKKSISFDASKIQVTDKIRHLRKKYMGKVNKYVESLPKVHDMDCLKLSKSIWGSGGLAFSPIVKKKKSEKKVKPRGSLNNKKSEKKLESLEANSDNVEADREVLANGDEKKEEDREVLVNGKKVDREVLVNGGDSKPDWFEESFLVGYIAGLGVGEGFVKQKWSMVSVETKKRMEDKWKLLQAKEMELVLQKTDFMREVGSVIAEAS